MDTEKILSKLTPKDYHNELEVILEDKDFSEDVKNLLLSCIYKIEAGYPDYETVKRKVESKKECLEEILKIIKEKCNSIEIKKEPIKDIENNLQARYEIDILEGSITLWYPNEKILLYAIYKLDDNPIYVDEKYSLIRTSLSELLNKGENINRLEVLRDFNGWNWNTDPSEIQNITINLVYQNFIELLGLNFMKQWVHEENMKDYLALATQSLEKEFGKKNSKEIIKLISKISLMICVQNNEKEKKHILEEKKELEEELAKLEDKKALLEEITKKKKVAREQIKEIDTILNDKKRLEKEYVERNAKLPEYHKIFSLAHLTEILTRQRKKIIIKMEEENKILEPSYYVKAKTQIEEKLELLSDLDLLIEKQNEKIVSYTILLQKIVMECLKVKIQQIDELEKLQKKETILNEIYQFRYYKYLYIEKDKCIYQEKGLHKIITQVEELLIQKAIQAKCMNVFAKDEKNNFEISRKVFQTRIINLENIVLELNWKEELEVLLYETDILEGKMSLEIDKKDLLVKLNKKIKLLG